LLELLVLLVTLYLLVGAFLATCNRRWTGLIGRVLFLAAVWMAALPIPLLDEQYPYGRDSLGILAFLNAFALRWSLAWLGVLSIGLLLVSLVKQLRRRFPPAP
jgi:hypothetical protein